MRQHEYILAIDQSTAGTKALLFDEKASLCARHDVPHAQLIVNKTWIEHSPLEIYTNTLLAAKMVLQKAEVEPRQVRAIGIVNQRETGLLWTKQGHPVYNAIVWQCGRGQEFCDAITKMGMEPHVKQATGLTLSPYFTASKFAWILQNVPGVAEMANKGEVMAGTVDAWLVYKLTGNHRTDFSNASRTQLFNIHTQKWDDEVCGLFDMPLQILPEVCPSDSIFGYSNLEGILPKPVPVCGVMGDSNAALFAQGCTKRGRGKATYGTGSSVMINTGDTPLLSEALVTSIAWKLGGKVQYVLEGNVNYAGGVLKWLQEDLELVASPAEASRLAQNVADNGGVYLVPAFSGLGAPHWDASARALVCGIGRDTKKAHVVRAAEECIAYQVADIIAQVPEHEICLDELRVDGGPTRDAFLMQFQADILQMPLKVSSLEELSGAGGAFVAGLACGLYDEAALAGVCGREEYRPGMAKKEAERLYVGWKKAVQTARYKPDELSE